MRRWKENIGWASLLHLRGFSWYDSYYLQGRSSTPLWAKQAVSLGSSSLASPLHVFYIDTRAIMVSSVPAQAQLSCAWSLCHRDSSDRVVTVLLILLVVVGVSVCTTIMLHNKVLQIRWLKIKKNIFNFFLTFIEIINTTVMWSFIPKYLSLVCLTVDCSRLA